MQTLNDDIIGQTVFFCRINRFCFCCHARGWFGHGALRLRVTRHEPHKALHTLGAEDGITERRVLKLNGGISHLCDNECLAILQIDGIANGVWEWCLLRFGTFKSFRVHYALGGDTSLRVVKYNAINPVGCFFPTLKGVGVAASLMEYQITAIAVDIIIRKPCGFKRLGYLLHALWGHICHLLLCRLGCAQNICEIAFSFT